MLVHLTFISSENIDSAISPHLVDLFARVGLNSIRQFAFVWTEYVILRYGIWVT